MRAINKGREPSSLTVHRKTLHCDYDNYKDKNTLRHSLATEQRGLCCYCMGRIRPNRDEMKVEHWQSQACYSTEQLSYHNLLAACIGGQGKPTHLQHCDTKKGDRLLEWNPADPTHHIETRIRYETDGTIRSNEADYDSQLNKVLNLNLPLLKNNRKQLLDVVLDWWKYEKAKIGGQVPRDRYVRKLDQHTGGNDELKPYCQVSAWWIKQKLAKMAA